MPRITSSKCSYRENGRRCGRNGDGNPPLCPAHKIAFMESLRPRRPTEVLADALASFLAGKPINVEATVGAADTLFGQWAQPRPWPFPPSGNVPRHAQQPPPPQPPPPPDPRVEAKRLEQAARLVMGFSPSDRLTEALIKERKRRLAKKYHPDIKGGSVHRMAAVNDAADVLMAAL